MNRFPFSRAGFIAIVVFGVAGDALLRAMPWGLNFSLWAAVLYAVVLWRTPADAATRIPLAAAILFSVLFSWREAEPLKCLLLAIILGSTALAAAVVVGRSPRAAFVWDYVIDVVNFAAGVVSLPFLRFIRHVPSPSPSADYAVPPWVTTGIRGVLLAAPLLLLFGSLLVSADALFERAIGYVLDVNHIASHTAFAGGTAWAAFTICALCLTTTIAPPLPRNDPGKAFKWGIAEINVALGLVALLFVFFVALQADFITGIYRHPIDSRASHISGYARRGFFQLAWVASIALVVLVSSARLLPAAGTVGKRAYKIIAAVMVLSILGIIASALHRMSLYIDVFGLTRLRVYTSLFMGWMAVVFLWLYFTILRERIRSFAWGFVLSGYLATFFVVAINPDMIIASINLREMNDNRRIDTGYVGNLSADAIPMMIQRFPYLKPENQATLKYWIARHADAIAQRDPRSMTVGLLKAQTALKEFELSPDAVNP